MYKIDFEKPIHIHFIGIGGISMSGLAEILLKEGFTVSGSDNKASALTEQLEKNGAKIFIGQRAANITKDIQLVVYTAAIHPDNAEWKAANDAGIPMQMCIRDSYYNYILKKLSRKSFIFTYCIMKFSLRKETLLYFIHLQPFRFHSFLLMPVKQHLMSVLHSVYIHPQRCV